MELCWFTCCWIKHTTGRAICALADRLHLTMCESAFDLLSDDDPWLRLCVKGLGLCSRTNNLLKKIVTKDRFAPVEMFQINIKWNEPAPISV